MFFNFFSPPPALPLSLAQSVGGRSLAGTDVLRIRASVKQESGQRTFSQTVEFGQLSWGGWGGQVEILRHRAAHKDSEACDWSV